MTSTGKLPFSRLALYSLPGLALSLSTYPLTAILPTHYARHHGLSLAAIGTVLFVSRVFDGVIDPAIGYFSDKTARWPGGRRAWLVIGAAISMVGIYFLNMPGPGADVTYFAVWSLVCYLGWSLFQIPYFSWGNELSKDYGERSRIVTVRAMIALLGTMLFLALPYLPGIGSKVVDQSALSASTWIALVLIPLFVGLAIWRVGPGVTIETSPAMFGSLFSSIGRNRPFQCFLLIECVGGLARGMQTTLFFMFITDYLKLSADFSWIAGVQILVVFLSMGAWLWVVARLGKHRAWALGIFLGLLLPVAYFFMPPGQTPPWVLAIVLCSFAFVGAVQLTIPWAVLGDVIDYDTLRTGVNRAGNYFAIMSLVEKLNVAVGGALGFFLLALFGYTVGGDNGPTAQFGMLFAFVVVPTLLQLVALPLVARFPIDQRRFGIISRRLLSLGARAERANVGQLP